MRVLLIAAPLVTTGGVYRSTHELVAAARKAGLDWTALIVVRGDLLVDEAPEGVEIVRIDDSGIKGLGRIRRLLAQTCARLDVDVVISMLPQSDMLLTTLPRRAVQLRVAYVRGAPWPRRGESPTWKRWVWRTLERTALHRMDDVWTTTTILRDEIAWPKALIVPAGIAGIAEAEAPRRGRRVVWAARMSVDKNPELFLKMMSNVTVPGRMYGDGELRQKLIEQAPSNVDLPGWIHPAGLWEDAIVYAGTSFREAFGRSAVEAAAHGIPVILSRAFGAAPLLYTDPLLARKFVLDPEDATAWADALRILVQDETVRQEVAAHVKTNALNLTIESSVAAVQRRLETLAPAHKLGKDRHDHQTSSKADPR